MSEKYVCPMEDPALSERGRALLWAKLGLDLVIGLGSVLLNGFIVLAVLPGLVRRRAGRPSKMLVVNLAATDALGGLMQIHYHLTQSVCAVAHWEAQRAPLCIAKGLSVVLVGMMSINSLAAIGYDRYLCIVHSLRYAHIMTTRRSWCLIGLVWGLSALGTGLLVLGHRWRPPETACVEEVLIPAWLLLAVGVPMNMTDLGIIAITHLRIRREVGRSVAMHRAVAVAGPGDEGRGSGAGAYPSACPNRRLSSSSVKSARVLVLVVGCYVLAFMPVIVVMILRALRVGGEAEMNIAFRATCSLAILNFVANPFTYAWKNAALKADLVALWARLSRRRQHYPRDGNAEGSTSRLSAKDSHTS